MWSISYDYLIRQKNKGGSWIWVSKFQSLRCTNNRRRQVFSNLPKLSVDHQSQPSGFLGCGVRIMLGMMDLGLWQCSDSPTLLDALLDLQVSKILSEKLHIHSPAGNFLPSRNLAKKRTSLPWNFRAGTWRHSATMYAPLLCRSSTVPPGKCMRDTCRVMSKSFVRQSPSLSPVDSWRSGL